jgi:hypothetical protein
MPSSNARRSKRHEREIVHAAEEAGITAERAWNSDGRSLGEHEECDVRLEAPGGSTWTAQAKRRKTVADYLTCDGADVVVTRQDRSENLVVLPLDRFLSLLKETADPLGRLLNELDRENDLNELLDELDELDPPSELLDDLGDEEDLSALLEELDGQ